jgi:pilus assembly protein Flp/PilA
MKVPVSVWCWLAARVPARPRFRGQGMVEYGLILALVAVIALVALGGLGRQLGTVFQHVTSSLP